MQCDDWKKHTVKKEFNLKILVNITSLYQLNKLKLADKLLFFLQQIIFYSAAHL